MAVFDIFLTKGGRHPLATRGGVQGAIDALPTAVRREALHKAAEWFASLDSPGLSAAQRLDILLSFDDAVHKFQGLLWMHLRGSQTKDLAFVGTRRALIEYCAEFSRQVNRLIDEVAQNSDQKHIRGDDLFVLAARGLRALDGWKRARHLDHEIIPPEIWARLFATLRFAFQWKAETREIQIYKDETTTLQREFLHAVILDTLPLANLGWRQIEIMNAVLDRFSDKFLLGSEAGQLTPYFLDLSQNSGPQHASRTLAPDSAIFVGPGAAFPDIVELAGQLSANHDLPTWLNLPKNSNTAEIMKALTLTIRHWSRTPPQRKLNRRLSTESLQIVHGFQQTRAALSLMKSTAKTDTPALGYYANNPIYTTQQLGKPRRAAPDTAETWEIVDESPTGVGIVPRIKPPMTLAVGALIGCFRTREEQWQIAIARRTSHDRKGRFLVGIQFIRGSPRAASIGLRINKTGAPLTRDDITWCEVIALDDQKILLVERRGFSPGMIAQLQVCDQDKQYIKLAKLEEAHVDWEYWSFLPTTERE
jgi:hypothetical protein